MRLPAALVFALAVPSLAFAASPTRQVLTHEMLWMMKRVGAPAVSPDGKWVVYPVTEPAYDADKAVSDLWLVPADGSAPPRRLTSTRAPEGDPAWAPDSHRIAFTTRREGDEEPQVYVLDIAGGEARRVTTAAVAAAHPKWRPDGAAILYEAALYPGAIDDEANRKAAAARKARKFNLRVYQHFPIRYWNEWLDDRRLTLRVQPLAEGAAPVDLIAASQLAKTEGFGGVPQGDGGYTLAPVWSPDGKEVVFTATTDRWKAARGTVDYQLWRVPAAGGEPAPLTPATGDFSDATFTPDGAALIVQYAPPSDQVYDLPRLHRIAWPAGGAPVPLTPGFDREVASFAITPDSKAIFLQVPDAGIDTLWRIPASGGAPTQVIRPETGGYSHLAIGARDPAARLIANRGSSVSPQEVVTINPRGRPGHSALTSVNTALAAGIDWQPPRHFTFTSPQGRTLHSMVVLPPNFDPAKNYPLLVLIHGGPAASNMDQIGLRWNYHLLAAPGYVVLMTDYKGSTGYGEAFTRSILHDPLKGPGEDVDAAVDEAARRFPFIDAGHACAAGASYGGHLVNWIEATSTRYKCIVSHAGEVDLLTQWGTSDSAWHRELMNGSPPWSGAPVWREQSPITYAERWKTPMLLTAGERDFRVPLSNTLETWTTLQRMNVPSRLLVFPDAWHWITKPEDSRQFYREVHSWLAHYLKGGPAAPAGPVEAQP